MCSNPMVQLLAPLTSHTRGFIRLRSLLLTGQNFRMVIGAPPIKLEQTVALRNPTVARAR